MRPLLLLLSRDIHRLEYDPATQYRFHFWATWFWLLNMPLVLVLLVCFQKFWLLIALVNITEISLWALVATHLGAMSAALAAKQTNPRTTQNKPLAAPQDADGQIIMASPSAREISQALKFDA